MEFSQKNICEVDLFDFTIFFGLDFFKFSGLLWYEIFREITFKNFFYVKLLFKIFQPWFKRLQQIEDGITEKGIFQSRLRKIFKQTAFPSSVEDDHKPFEKQGEFLF